MCHFDRKVSRKRRRWGKFYPTALLFFVALRGFLGLWPRNDMLTGFVVPYGAISVNIIVGLTSEVLWDFAGKA